MATPLEKSVDKAAYEIISAQNQEMAAILSDLVGKGQTPEQIGRHVREMGATPLLANLMECAAAYLQENPQA